MYVSSYRLYKENELTLLHHTTLLLLEDNRYKIIIGGAVTIRSKILITLIIINVLISALIDFLEITEIDWNC